MPNHTTEKEANRANLKTKCLQKSLAKLNVMSREKKPIQPPEEILHFLQAEDTFDEVLKVTTMPYL